MHFYYDVFCAYKVKSSEARLRNIAGYQAAARVTETIESLIQIFLDVEIKSSTGIHKISNCILYCRSEQALR